MMRTPSTRSVNLDASPPNELPPPTWAAWRDGVANADHRPDAWREAALFSINGLATFLGETWLEETWHTTGSLPAEILYCRSHAFAFARLLDLALRIEQLQGTPGLARVREEVRRDRTPHRWLHTSLQLEVAALTQAQGAAVSFEIAAGGTGRRLDVDCTFDGERIAFETRVLRPSDLARRVINSGDRASDGLMSIEMKYGVTCYLDQQLALSDDAIDAWLDQVRLAAAAVAGGRGDLCVDHVGLRCRVTAEALAPNTQIRRGPPIGGNSWRRVVRRVVEKIDQTRGTENVWLRFDLFNHLWQFTPFAAMSLADKVVTIASSLCAALSHVDAEPGHVAGVILSDGAALVQVDAEDEAREENGAFGLRRALRPIRARETVVVPLGDGVGTDLVRAAYGQEGGWLDHRLEAIGLPERSRIFG